ncbi:ribonucleoside triphosphate reductase [Anaeromyxobacter diazotrophicus]|uniref:Anaerobic ribonucleoside triphosphate reductase n=1 Tax=Anaeromyxobacter diazotrophicus TaxID=2590199 RepID=A0A7I9VRY7_9BACT|nr:ribonucleoside triphosphate reductase [Anaeromyxobacter diazotrophicus]GEJ58687.1 anaerobic ribonucleoside triphosphate reductase [Anaeromyxobacter diazotrophicus]
MFEHIEKRDGRVVPFDAERIIAAIAKAGAATGELDAGEARRLGQRVLAIAAATFEGRPTVERVQDVVEDVLLASPHRRTARAYAVYREQHRALREISDAASVALVDAYLERADWQVSENANMAFSLQGLNNYVASHVSSTYWLERLYPPEVRDAHRAGDLHLHDLNLLAVYCVGWDLADLLEDGFRGAPGKAESAPARHFRTALGQIANFFYTLQGEAAGAQAFSSLDTYLAPFIRQDGLGYEEVRQALQEFVFNLNVPTRVGFQTPFTNVTLDLECPAALRGEAVIVGGARGQTTYGEHQPEMDLFNRAFLDVMAGGDAKGRVFTFPIPTYNVTPGFDYDDPRLDGLWEVTARYGLPYFANFVNSDLSPEDARSMCCRLRLDTRGLERRGGGLFGASPLTGSIGVVTVNLPRLGHLARDEADFLRRLDRVMDLARDSLVLKRKVLERYTEQGLYPYVRHYLRHIRARSGSYWRNHFSTIGLVGLAEAVENLLGVPFAQDPGRAFGLRVLDHMRARLERYQAETGTPFNLEATPAEATSYRLARLDKARHPAIRCANEAAVAQGAAPYYTNSSQLPVDATDDVFEVLDHQDAFQARYTGGTVQHVFVGEAIHDPAAVKRFVKVVCERYRLPYFTVTPTFSVCGEHGYLAGEHPTCPRCGAAAEVYSRIVGYLRPLQQWNPGKQAEYARRRSLRPAEAPRARP